jgi:NTE family protein
LDATRYHWFKYIERRPESGDLDKTEGLKVRKTRDVQPMFPRVHLWDGGVYDNHGLEGLIDVTKGWRDKVEFLIVSDGAGRSRPESYRRGAKALMRIATGIMMDQVRSLRARTVLERLINHGDVDKGSFLQIGNSCSQILAGANQRADIPQIAPDYLSDEEASLAEHMPTVVRKLTQQEFERLFRHGFEVADLTLSVYNASDFARIGFKRQVKA